MVELSGHKELNKHVRDNFQQKPIWACETNLGWLVLDLGRRIVYSPITSESKKLSLTELDILKALIVGSDSVVRYAEMFQYVWGEKASPDLKIIYKTRLGMLRQKLGETPTTRIIYSVHREGHIIRVTTPSSPSSTL